MKILKKSLKVVGIIIASTILFMILLVAGAKVFEDELASFTMERLESEIDAPMSIGKVSLIPLFSFPQLSAEINNLWIGDPKKQNGDTLFFINSLKVSLDSWDLINRIYTIDKAEISGLTFDYFVDRSGNSNIDFLLYSFVDTVPEISNNNEAVPFDFSADKFKLENIHVNYYDSSTLTGSRVFIPEIDIKAKTKNNIYTGESEGSFVLSNCTFKNTKVGQMQSCMVIFELDYEDNKAIIKELSINSEGINLNMTGVLNFTDTLTIDANVDTKTLNLDILKKYIPNKYFEEYGIIDVGGNMDLSAQIKGKYADSTKLPLVDADIDFRNIRLQTADYPNIDTMNLTVKISNGEKLDMSEASINIAKLEIFSNYSSISLEGTINDFKNPLYYLNSSLDINLQEFENLIPDSLAKNLEGNISALIETKGILPNIISADFIDYVLANSKLSLNLKEVSALLVDSLQLEDVSAEIKYSSLKSGAKKNILINNLNLKSNLLNLHLQNSSLTANISGKFSDPLKMSADLQSFMLQSGKNKIIGNGQIKNFGAPEFEIKTNIDLNLEELMAFIPDSVINKMTGSLTANIETKGKINANSLDTQIFPILFENSVLDLTLNNITLAFPDTIMNIDNLSTKIGLKDDLLKIDNFSATYNRLKIEIDSSLVKNIYKAVILNKNEELYVKTYIRVGDIIFDDFKHLMALETSTTAVDTNSHVKNNSIDTGITTETQNWTYLIHGAFSVNSLAVDSTTFEGFNINRLHVNGISTLFKLTDSSYIMDQFKFNVFEGEMNSSIHYKVREDGMQSISTHNLIRNMNIRTMLRDMDNFGMDSVITFENINGLFSTDLNTFVPIDDSILIDKMLVSGDITLEKGGVYNFPPAQEISKFTSIKELDNIQFKTLRSKIFMFKNKFYVPRTNIVSNALDIAAFGMQSLAGDSEYHMELHLSNILFGKSKKRNKKQDISGEEIDEESLKKHSRKLKYVVTEGKSKVGVDTQDARNQMMNKIRVQKKMLDFIFFPKNINYNTEPY